MRLKGDIELSALLAGNKHLRVAGGEDEASSAGHGPGPLTPPARTPAQAQGSLLELREWSVVLPLPPSNNKLYDVNRETGAKFLLPSQKAYRQLVMRVVRFGREPPPMLLGRLEAWAHFYFADRRKIDIRNLVKALDDALVHAHAMKDDSQIDIAHEYRHLIRDDSTERVLVVMKEIAQ